MSENAENNELKGLGGWLVLVGIGLLFAPVRMVVSLFPAYSQIFEDGVWQEMTNASSSSYIPYLGTFIVGEMIVNLIILGASIYLIYLFYYKHYLFPKIYIAVVVGSILFMLVDAWLLTKILPGEQMFTPESAGEFVRSLIAAAIWVPYMLVSKRVRLTFVEHMPEERTQPAIESAAQTEPDPMTR